MYEIRKHDNHLLVEFLGDFNYPMVQTIIRHESMLKEYPDTNDIWLIGKHHADIRLGELEMMVREFIGLYPTDATRTKTAIVVNEGLSKAILELWVNGLQKHVAFDIKLFPTQEEAEAWLGIAKERVAESHNRRSAPSRAAKGPSPATSRYCPN